MKRITLIVILTAVLFGAAYAAFGVLSPSVWNSPDETAVAFFSRSYAKDGSLSVLDPYNVFGDERVHPRSILSVDAHLVPASFYGAMWLHAVAFKIFNEHGFALVTPLLTALAGIAVFCLVRRIMDARRAFVAELLFLMHPAVWYYASRGLFPNALFMDLAIIGIAALLLRPWRTLTRGKGSAFLADTIDDMFGTLCLALAFAVRAVEFIWLAPLLIAIIWCNRRGITLRRIVVPAIGAGLVLTALMVTNASLYGNALSFGYSATATHPGVSVPALGSGSRLPSFISEPRPYVLPFGFHPHAAALNLWEYLVWFMPWFAVAAVLGMFTWRKSPWRRRLLYSLVWVTFSLGIYYGSGIFQDAIHDGLTVGSSYLRYFLPIILIAIPFAAYGICWLGERIYNKRSPLIIGGVLTAFFILSYWTVLYRNPESLVPVNETLVHYAEIKKEVLRITDPRDVIIVERSDKVFFPDRRVMLDLRDPATLTAISKLLHLGNVYYYGINISEIEYPQIVRDLEVKGMTIGRVHGFESETLYAITMK